MAAEPIPTWSWISQALRERHEALISGYYTSEVATAVCNDGSLGFTTTAVEVAEGFVYVPPVDLVPDLVSTGLLVVGYQTNVWTNVVGVGTAATTNVTTEINPVYDLDYVKTSNVLYSIGGTNCSIEVVNGRYVTNHAPSANSRYLDAGVVSWMAQSAILLIDDYVDMKAVGDGTMDQPLPANEQTWAWLNYTNLYGQPVRGWAQLTTNYPAAFPSLTQSQVWERTGIGTTVVYLTVVDRGTNYPQTVTNVYDGWEVGQLDVETVSRSEVVDRYQVTTNRRHLYTYLRPTETNPPVVTLARLTAFPEDQPVSSTGRYLTAYGFHPADLNGTWTRGAAGWERAGYRLAPDTNELDVWTSDLSWLEFPEFDGIWEDWAIYDATQMVFRIGTYAGWPRGCAAPLVVGVTGGFFTVSATWQESDTRQALSTTAAGGSPSVDPDRYQAAVVLRGPSNWTEACASSNAVVHPGGDVEDVAVVITGSEARRGPQGQWLTVTTTNVYLLPAFGELPITNKLFSVSAISATVARASVGGLEVAVEVRLFDTVYGLPGRLYEETLMHELAAVLTSLTHTARGASFAEVGQAITNLAVDYEDRFEEFVLPAWPAYASISGEVTVLSFSASASHTARNQDYRYTTTINGDSAVDEYSVRLTRFFADLSSRRGRARGGFGRPLSALGALYLRMDDPRSGDGLAREAFVSSYRVGSTFEGVDSSFSCSPVVTAIGAEEVTDAVYAVGGGHPEEYRARFALYGYATKAAGAADLDGPAVDPVALGIDAAYGLFESDTTSREVWSGSAVCQVGNVSWDVSNIDRNVRAYHAYPLSGSLRGQWLMQWAFTPPP